MKLQGMCLLEDSTIIVSEGLLTTCATKFADAAADAVDKAVASGKLAAAPAIAGSSSSGGKVGGKASMGDRSDDEDDGRGKRGKGKKNKSSRALMKEEAAAAAAAKNKSRKGGKKGKKGSAVRGGVDDATDDHEGAVNRSSRDGGSSQQLGAAALTPSIQAMAKVLQTWYEEHEMSREVAEGIADVLRPALVRAYVEAHRSAFASMAESRKKKQQAFESVLQQTADNFALFHKGAETLPPSARVQLAQHLLREHGVDIVASE